VTIRERSEAASQSTQPSEQQVAPDAAFEIVVTTSLGLGVLSIAVLALGSAGFLQRPVWLSIIGVFAAIGLAQLVLDARSTGCDNLDRTGWLWCILIPFAALAMLAALLPPGILWPAEANGYDVLEYHLTAPREYLEAGRIAFLPHNIYSNFPFNMEMLYLLLMILRGDAVQAAISAQLLHVAVGALAVAGIWLAGRTISNRTGFVAAILAAGCPVLLSLASLAYVESALILFAALALAAMSRSRQTESSGTTKWMLLSGAFTGLACGCKYIAVPCLLVPLAIASFFTHPRQMRTVTTFLFGAVITFSPWLIKNAVMTGNPVFPLACSVFKEKPGIWTDDCAQRWHEGHLPAPADRPLARRCALLVTQVFTSAEYGLLPVLALASIAMLLRRRRQHPLVLPCVLTFLAVIITWIFFTHLVGRFAILLVPPACLLVAVACDRSLTNRALQTLILVTAVLINAGLLMHLFADSHVVEIASERRSDSLEWFSQGQWPAHEHVPILNKLLDEKRKILMVADARRFYLRKGVDYCVVFNPNPFADAAEKLAPTELLKWLRAQGYDFIHVDWGEMRRLRRTRYGFWKSIDEKLFESLVKEGLTPVEQFRIEGRAAPYATLFAIPPAPWAAPQTSARSTRPAARS
jgi:hypothetical protein